MRSLPREEVKRSRWTKPRESRRGFSRGLAVSAGGHRSPGFSRVFALTIAVAGVVACENPRPPVSCGVIPAQTVFAGEVISVDACFDDPNGDELVYEAATSDPGVAMARVAGTAVAVDGVAPGSADVTVTATDEGGLAAEVRFQVVVPNRNPAAVGVIPSLELAVGDSATVELAGYFDDPDGQGLTYAAEVSGAGVAGVSVAGSELTVAAGAKGVVTVTATATDPGGLTAVQSFVVTVPNRAPGPVGSIPGETVLVGETMTLGLAPYFHDPDEDPLVYSAIATDATVAVAAVSGDAVSVTALAKGEATVTVTATDTEGLTATQAFGIAVPNRAPLAVGKVPSDTVAVGESRTLDPSGYFRDPDGDPLVYVAASSDSSVIDVSAADAAITVTGVAKGEATVTITATDTEGLAATQPFTVRVPLPPPAELRYELRRTLPHDAGAYTQGLLIHDSIFYESTGRYGRSEVRQVEIASGRVLLSHPLSNEHFGEGLARVGDRLVQLTWKAGLAFVYDAATLQPLDTLEYEGEGWGLCHDGESLFMSNGSDTLQRRDPNTFGLLEEVRVTRNDSPVRNVNELECVGEDIYANVYGSNEIVRIERATGVVTGVLDAEALALASRRPEHGGSVFNGIAYDGRTGTFYVTGKLWPVMFEIELRER